MSPKQRFYAALELRPVDRVPLFYQNLGAAKWILESTGLKMFDGFHDPETFAKLALEAYRLYGYDTVMAGWGDLLIEAQAHGMQWKFPEKDFYPRVASYLPPAEADRLEPVDPMKDRFWSVPIRAAELMVKQVGEEVAVVGCTDSPMWAVCELFGLEGVLMALFTEPGPIDSALRTMTESLRTYGERIRDTGVGSVFIDSSSAGGELMSREMYERHDRPCLKAIIDSYRSLGLKTIVHNDSTMPMWQSQMEIDPDALHLHLRHVDRDVLFKAIKGHACLFAGIDHQELIFKHTPSEIDESVRGTLEQWGGSPGIVIAPGCELPYKTPRDNIQALKEAVIKHSSRTL